jgi:Domain of unknown function (DUF4288)
VDFYSARLLYIILVDTKRATRRHHYDDSVVVFRARNYAHAFRRALELGRKQESSYKNHRDENVRWALVEVENLDLVGKVIDGVEVASRLHSRTSQKPVPPRKQLRPERSKPSESF